MRISDWSSDVCSSDLGGARAVDDLIHRLAHQADMVGGEVEAVHRRAIGVLGQVRHHDIAGREPRRHHRELGRVGQHIALADCRVDRVGNGPALRSEEHTSELQSLMRISYAVFCLKKNNTSKINTNKHYTGITYNL